MSYATYDLIMEHEMDLKHALSGYQAIRDRIIALESSIDDETLADTLEGMTDLHEVVAAIVRSALIDEALAEGLKSHINRLQERLQRLNQRGAARRQIAREAMVEVDLKRITAPDFTITVRPGSPALVVTDERTIPSTYWTSREPRLDRISLLNDLKRGMVVEGATLSNPAPMLSVRV